MLFDQQLLDSLTMPVAPVFAEYADLIDSDPLKKLIRLDHLLTMTAGFEWDEDSYPYEHPLNDVTRLAQSSDWLRFIWQQPMIFTPGHQFVYNSACTVLLSGLIQKKAGLSASEFAQIYLFQPLDISRWNWERGSGALTNTGWGLSLTAIDMVKFGYLYLNVGEWNTTQVISEEWIQASTKNFVTIDYNSRYAYQWWRFSDEYPIASQLKINDLYFAWGHGGQFIFIIPHLHMVVVSTAANFTNSGYGFYMLRDFVLPAVKDTSS
jgi:CubicO group peptidase (beta-lactamase class C family)